MPTTTTRQRLNPIPPPVYCHYIVEEGSPEADNYDVGTERRHLTHGDACAQCGHCTLRHCLCNTPRCSQCQTRIPGAAQVCAASHCRNCCGCHTVQEQEHRNRMRSHGPWAKYPGKASEENPTTRLVATEIEVAAFNQALWHTALYPLMDRWQPHTTRDGSLPSTGIEMQTACASGEAWPRMIRDICAFLARVGSTISAACGLHVHVDCRDLDYAAVRRLVFLYAACEAALFQCIAPSRRDNRYCVPCGQRLTMALATQVPESSEDARKALDGAIYQHSVEPLDNYIRSFGPVRGPIRREADIRRRKNNHYDEQRYSALNVHSFYFRGTVECRMYQGTIDPTEIIPWGIFWAGLVQHAKDMPDAAAVRLKGRAFTVEELANLAPTPAVGEWLVAQERRFRGATAPSADDEEQEYERNQSATVASIRARDAQQAQQQAQNTDRLNQSFNMWWREDANAFAPRRGR